MIELGPNRYGKTAIRLVKVVRGGSPGAPDVVRDLTVAIALDGDFGAAYVAGDNAGVIATDTMKNTVYAFAADRLGGSIEAFGSSLAGHFAAFGQVDRATVTIREHAWRPIELPGGPARDAFLRPAESTRLAIVSADRRSTRVEAGVEDLTVMKTRRSAFGGFPRDAYTTLAETADRLLATRASATWRYADDTGPIDHDAEFTSVRATLLATFADHDSRSVQETIWIVGRAILERHAAVAEVRLTMPNLHHWAVDLRPFGVADGDQVFVATSEPYGLIEATVRRTGTGPARRSTGRARRRREP